MDHSSADPAHLEAFVRATDDMNEVLAARTASLRSLYDDVVPGLRYGTFDASGLLDAAARFVRLNQADGVFVTGVAEGFRLADSSAGPVSVADARILERLAASGVDATPRASITFDDPVARGVPPTSGYSDDPVCTATGHFLEAELDVVLPGRAGPLNWVRTYSSRWLETGSFGRGWWTWADVVARSVEGATEVVFPDGKRARFLAGQRRVPGIAADLVVDGTGLALAFSNGDRWRFDAGGVLAEVICGGRDRVSFRRDADGRLIELVHDKGRWLRLAWDAGRVRSVTSSDGQRLGYSYDDHGDLIEAAGGPAGLRRYVQAGRGLIASVVDADGVVEAANTYDRAGRVITQTSPFGRVTRFSYRPGGITVVADDQGGPSSSFFHDAMGRLVAAVDDDGARMTKRYDDWGNPIAVTDRTGAVVVQLFDDRGRLLVREEPDGAVTRFEWDELDRLVARVQPDGGRVELAYEGVDRQPSRLVDAMGATTVCGVVDGEIVAHTDPDGVVTRYERDADGLVTAVIDAAGRATQFERDGSGEAVAVVDPSGAVTRVDRDEAGRVVARHLPDGAVVGFEWTPAGRLQASVSPTGARAGFTHGAHGEVEALADSTGAVTTFGWDVWGRNTSLTNPLGDTVSYRYDGLGALVGIDLPDGGTSAREYDAEGRLVATVDPSGVREERRYDEVGRPVAELDANGHERRSAYDAAGRVIEVADAAGGVTRMAYDAVGRLVSVRDAEEQTTTYAWTPGGRLVSVTSPTGGVTAYRYDATGELAAIVDPTGGATRVERDGAGRVVRWIDPVGETAEADHDAVGRVVARRDAAGAETRAHYDHAGRVVETVDAEGGACRFAYDPAGRLTEAVNALGHATTIGYDVLGMPTGVVDPLGGEQHYRSDPLGRLVGWSDQNGMTTAIERDAAGRIVAHHTPAGGVRFRRDAAGRMVGWQGTDDVAAELTLDANGLVVGAIGPDGSETRYERDRLGRITESVSPEGRVATTWTADDRPAKVSVDGQPTVSYGYDAAGRVVGVTGPEGRVQVGRDAAGNVVGVSTPNGNRRLRRHRGRVTAQQVRVGTERRTVRYRYDAMGRVAIVEDREGITRCARDAAGQLTGITTPKGTYRYAYDAAGRRTLEATPSGERSFAYDAAGQLTSVSTDAGAVTFGYDGAGRRSRRRGADGTETTYTWSSFGHLQEVDRRDPDAAGGSAERVDIGTDAFGRPVEIDGQGLLWDPSAPTPTLHKPVASGADSADEVAGFGVTPRGEVQVDGLRWMGARLYDPDTASFCSRDPLPAPLGSPTTANPYAYAYNDPTTFTDPLGLTPLSHADYAQLRGSAGRDLVARGGGLIEDAWEWTKDHGDEIAAVGTVVVGGILLFTPAAPIGAGMLLGAGASAGTQLAFTGEIDARQVWTSGVAGAAGGGGGMAAAGLTAGRSGASVVALNVGMGAGTDMVTSAGTQYATTGHVNRNALVLDTVVGAGVAGAPFVKRALPPRGVLDVPAAGVAGTPSAAARVVEKETIASSPLKPEEAVQAWERFLGAGPHSAVHPRTGLPDLDRIVSADGTRSIRLGSHEMKASPTKSHYHEETWSYDPVGNMWTVDNTIVRVPLPKGNK